MRKSVLCLIRFYQKYISPAGKLIFPIGVCRFAPTCSEYAAAAVREHGAIKGVVLSIKRIARCHPFSRGGFEPVP